MKTEYMKVDSHSKEAFNTAQLDAVLALADFRVGSVALG